MNLRVSWNIRQAIIGLLGLRGRSRESFGLTFPQRLFDLVESRLSSLPRLVYFIDLRARRDMPDVELKVFHTRNADGTETVALSYGEEGISMLITRDMLTGSRRFSGNESLFPVPPEFGPPRPVALSFNEGPGDNGTADTVEVQAYAGYVPTAEAVLLPYPDERWGMIEENGKRIRVVRPELLRRFTAVSFDMPVIEGNRKNLCMADLSALN